MDYHLFLEGVVEKLEVAVSLIGFVADFQCVDPLEILGMRAPDSQPLGVLPYIFEDDIQVAVTAENLVVIARLENPGFVGLLIDGGFQPGNHFSQRLVQDLLHRYKEMNMVGHDDILKQPDFWLDFGDIEDGVSGKLAQWGEVDADAPGLGAGTGMNGRQFSKRGCFGGLIHGDEIDASGPVIMPEGPAFLVVIHEGKLRVKK